MKITKRLLIGLMCLIMTMSACTVFVSAKNEIKAQPKVKSATSSTITLSWGKIKGAGGYYVYKSVDGKWKKLADTKKVTYTAKGLTASESYKFAVRHYTVKNNKKTLAKSFGTVTGKTKVLSKVSNFTAVTNDDTITLNWKKLSGATGYRVYIKNDSGKWDKLTTVGSSVTKYTLNKDTAFRAYTFRIKPYAKTAKGTVWGSHSECKSKINDNAAPKILSASTDAFSAEITWQKIDGASGYRIYLFDKTGKSSVVARTYGEDNTSYTLKNLDSDTEYKFAVRAFIKLNDKAYFGAIGDVYTLRTEKANLDIYRAEQVSELLSGKEFYIEYSEESDIYGKVDSVMALRMGKLYLKETVKGVSTEYIYNSANDEVYIIDAANKKYRIANDSEEFDIKLAALHEHMKIENMGTVTAKYKKGLICESFTESKYGRYMELSFLQNDKLAEIYIEYADGKKSTVTVNELKEETDPSLFEIPNGYTKA